jgi:alkanesulfonate monooxygenase SsuD/methylene tetrahydromethanopterin reductase-like flavin-dependent oxidoreductase (luciferase family)
VGSQLRGGSHAGSIDPVPIVAAVAMVSKSVSFTIIRSTTYLKPFLLARTLSTLDYLTKGRIGWNVVTSFGNDVTKQVGFDAEMDHDQRYEAAHEYMDLVYQ